MGLKSLIGGNQWSAIACSECHWLFEASVISKIDSDWLYHNRSGDWGTSAQLRLLLAPQVVPDPDRGVAWNLRLQRVNGEKIFPFCRRSSWNWENTEDKRKTSTEAFWKAQTAFCGLLGLHQSIPGNLSFLPVYSMSINTNVVFVSIDGKTMLKYYVYISTFCFELTYLYKSKCTDVYVWLYWIDFFTTHSLSFQPPCLIDPTAQRTALNCWKYENAISTWVEVYSNISRATFFQVLPS